MQNTKLVTLLKTFDKKELKDFEKFIISPFHIRDRDLKPLFYVIKKFYPDFTSQRFTKESIYKSLYPGKKYNEAHIRKLTSFLFKMAEDYLVHLALRGKKTERDFLLLGEFRKRGLDSSFTSLADTIDKEITSDKYSLDDFYINRLRYSGQAYKYFMAVNDFPQFFTLLRKQIDSAVALFLFHYLQGSTSKMIIKKAYTHELDSQILEGIESTFNIEKFFNSGAQETEMINLVIPLYYANKAMADLDDSESYNTAKRLFLENIDKCSQDVKYNFFSELININNARTNFYKGESMREAFDLVKLQLEHNAYRERSEKYMHIFVFRNILSMSLARKEFKWAEEFIERYIQEIEPEQRESMKNFALARLEHGRGNMEESLEYAIKVRYETFIFKMDIKHLNLMLFYDLELYEEARSFLYTTKKYYSSTKEVSQFFKERDGNFLHYYKLLLKYHDKPDKDEIEMESIKLISEEVITQKQWLMRKFEKLKTS